MVKLTSNSPDSEPAGSPKSQRAQAYHQAYGDLQGLVLDPDAFDQALTRVQPGSALVRTVYQMLQEFTRDNWRTTEPSPGPGLAPGADRPRPRQPWCAE